MIDFGEVSQLAVDLGQIPVQVEPFLKAVVAKTGLDTVAGAQKGLIDVDAVDTGNLLNSVGVDIDPDGLGFTAGPTADYGHFVEDGTSRMPGRPYMGPAFDIQVEAAVAAIEALAARVLG